MGERSSAYAVRQTVVNVRQSTFQRKAHRQLLEVVSGLKAIGQPDRTGGKIESGAIPPVNCSALLPNRETPLPSSVNARSE
jgi:hypothetical protein